MKKFLAMKEMFHIMIVMVVYTVVYIDQYSMNSISTFNVYVMFQQNSFSKKQMTNKKKHFNIHLKIEYSYSREIMPIIPTTKP